MAQNFRSKAGVLQNDGVHVPAESRFQRRNKFALDLETGREGASEGGPDSLRIVQPFEDGLRALAEAFAFFIQLLQNFEARLLFGDRSFDPESLFLGLREFLLARAQKLFRTLERSEKAGDGFLAGFARGLRAIEKPAGFIACACCRLNLEREFRHARERGFAPRLRAREIIAHRSQARFGFREGSLQVLQFALTFRAFSAQLRCACGQRRQLFLLCFKQRARLFNQGIGFLDLRRLFAPLAFGSFDVASIARDQLIDFFRALAIESDPAAVARDFALEALDFGTGIAGAGLERVQFAAPVSEVVLAGLDLRQGRAFGLFEPANLFPAMRQLSFQLFQFPARMMRVEHLQVGHERLITPCFSSLALE